MDALLPNCKKSGPGRSEAANDFSSVDPDEWLVQRDLVRVVPFRERHTHDQICYHTKFDDILDLDFNVWNPVVTQAGLPTPQ